MAPFERVWQALAEVDSYSHLAESARGLAQFTPSPRLPGLGLG
jgi:hypothetical protein